MSKPKVEIRAFSASDLPVLRIICKRAFAPVYRSFRELVGPDIAPTLYANAEEDQGGWLDHICAPGSGHHVCIAAFDDRIVGFCDHSCDVRTRIGTLGLNAVDPDFAGLGVGAALHDHALNAMRCEGMRVATVSTGLDDSHAAARCAYTRAGFLAAVPAVHLSQAL